MSLSGYPTQEDLLAVDLADMFDWVDANFLRIDPFAFTSASADYLTFARQASKALDVDPNGIFLVGSGAIGLSLNPTKVTNGHLKEFRARDSDLDLAIVSETHFEAGWRTLRHEAHPIAQRIDRQFQEALKHQRKRFFDGALLVSKLLSELPFATTWVPGMQVVSQNAALALNWEVKVNPWIFRDYWSVRSYVANSTIACRREMIAG